MDTIVSSAILVFLLISSGLMCYNGLLDAEETGWMLYASVFTFGLYMDLSKRK